MQQKLTIRLVYLLSEETVVKELQELNQSFISFGKDIHGKLAQFGKSSLHDIAVFYSGGMSLWNQGLTGVKTIDKLFDAILPYNDYLDCEFIVEDITKVKAHIVHIQKNTNSFECVRYVLLYVL